jgi:hypothetical protein
MMADELNTEKESQQPIQDDILASRGKEERPSQGIQNKKDILTSDETPEEEARNT